LGGEGEFLLLRSKKRGRRPTWAPAKWSPPPAIAAVSGNGEKRITLNEGDSFFINIRD